MVEPKVASYGFWASPISADLVTTSTIGLGGIVLEGTDTYWTELLPFEKGRTVVVRCTSDGHVTDVTPSAYSVRTRVHEYGGGAFAIQDGIVYFSNASDQQLYRQFPDAEPQRLTAQPQQRYADGVIDRQRQRWIGVCEDHSRESGEPSNSLVSVSFPDGPNLPRTLITGHDFYASPRLSPDGLRLAWLAWKHPQMPWDGTELWIGEFQPDGSIGAIQRVAGGANESIFQPEWSPDGRLYFVSDQTNWWNLYCWDGKSINPLYPMEVEFGRPQWVFGQSTYGFAGADRLICTYTQAGNWHLARLDTAQKQLDRIDIPYTTVNELCVSGNRVVFIGCSPTEVSAVVQLDLATGQLSVLRRSSELGLDPDYISVPQPITYPTGNGQRAHAFFYPPQNRDYTAPVGEYPPLLVRSHGGPTAATSTCLSLRKVQYWTSRGIAVLDVNYRGSTGYGRQYRQLLVGQWGIADVEDCINGARHLVEQGLVDGDRLIISGSSAGGFTTLSALAFHQVFQAGASYYGISDLEALVRDTHKFESRYFDTLLGPYPEQQHIYIARSPIHATDHLNCPVIFFQGLDDQVVPPNQAEAIVAALRRQGVPVAYLTFEGEQHGFRQAATIQRCLEAELSFYAQIFGFTPDDEIEPVAIDNLS